MRARFSEQRGIALIFLAVGLTLILMMVALAIDASYLYTVRAKLSASCDAAALAAARSLNVGLTMAEQEASARARALAFFDGNFPEGTMNTRNRTVSVDVAETALRTRTVSVHASVVMPTYFLRLAGFNTINVTAEGTASRRDVNLILVLDRSGSMANSGASPTPPPRTSRRSRRRSTRSSAR
jgi:Flp pilus assembly protein TadG